MVELYFFLFLPALRTHDVFFVRQGIFERFLIETFFQQYFSLLSVVIIDRTKGLREFKQGL